MPVLARYDESKDDLVSSRPPGLQRYEETSSESAGHDQEEFLGSTSTNHEGPTDLTHNFQFPMISIFLMISLATGLFLGLMNRRVSLRLAMGNPRLPK